MENICRVYELGCREVIDVETGSRLGYVGDVEIAVHSGEVRAIVIPGKLRLFGLLGREEDKVIPWSSIEKIGKDILLVRCSMRGRRLRSAESIKVEPKQTQTND
ncbi:MAG: YlmC/YmxH family sporulation protein [Clostridia bacterium]|nr:YlmC/YmxH family sporulation protein [Clostridia bacterium]